MAAAVGAGVQSLEVLESAARHCRHLMCWCAGPQIPKLTGRQALLHVLEQIGLPAAGFLLLWSEE
jgi:hypothetical protein